MNQNQEPQAQQALPATKPKSVLEYYSPEQLKLITDLVATDLRDENTGQVLQGELRLFLTTARAVGLDPLRKQIYAIMRWDSKLKRKRLTIQTGIDGFRAIAGRPSVGGRPSQYAGQVGPFWCGDEGHWVDVWTAKDPPRAAKVGILRHDFKEPCWGVVTWDAYVQKTKEGEPTKFWKQMPAEQLAKCAEAVALRKSFPEDLSGLYTHDEMAQADMGPRDAEVVDDGSRQQSAQPTGAQKAASKLSERAKAANAKAQESAPAQAASAPSERDTFEQPKPAGYDEPKAEAAITPASDEPSEQTKEALAILDAPLTDAELAAACDPANTEYLHEWRQWGHLNPPPWNEWKHEKLAEKGLLGAYTAEQLVQGEEGGGRHTGLTNIIEFTVEKYGKSGEQRDETGAARRAPEGAFKADYCLAVMLRRYEYTKQNDAKRAKQQQAEQPAPAQEPAHA